MRFGDMGIGHTVTAFYEIVPVGVESDAVGDIDDLKYQEPQIKDSDELLTAKLRYKEIDSNTSELLEVPVIDNNDNDVSTDFRFASAVVMYSQMLRCSKYTGDSTFDKVISLANSSLGNDEFGIRKEFVELVMTAKGLSTKK